VAGASKDSRDRWAFEEIPFKKDFAGCGGWNATAKGIYSR
jgi:hypothetical protein